MGNMHGDEPTGRQLCLAYALDLVTSTSAQAKDLRERSHTIIIPTLNPDGYDARSRENKCDISCAEAHSVPVSLTYTHQPDSPKCTCCQGIRITAVAVVQLLEVLLSHCDCGLARAPVAAAWPYWV